jgi:tetratricopeptide (TPR) repeat protein
VTELNKIFNHALACHQAGQSQQAAKLYRQILNLDGDHAQASNNLGAIFMSQGSMGEAVSCFQNAVNANADFFEAHLNLAGAYKKMGRYSEATVSFRRALAIKPDHIPAYLDLSFLCYQLGDTSGAISCCKKALAIDPSSIEAYNNLGNALANQGDIQSAIEIYNRALQISPDDADIYYNLANALKGAGRLHSAIEIYQQALALKPDNIDAHWNLSHALLLSGNFPDGWREYEWRFHLPGQHNIYPHHYEDPRWEGAAFKGKRLLVHDEQGLGDTLQFIRFLPYVKALGGTVIFESRKPLLKLLTGFPGIDELVQRSAGAKRAVDFDMFIPLMSLPALFGTTLLTLPSQVPYLYANPKAGEAWRDRLEGGDMKVGIVWSGNPGHANDQNRSCSLELFRPLANIGGAKLIGLQAGAAADQAENTAYPLVLENIGKEFADFTDTAATIEALDLVISVDTAVAHLAGAMGKPVWLMLPCLPDWRWLMDREDSPWYPTMRLFRQPKPGDWPTVIDQIRDSLKQLVAKRHTELRGSTRPPKLNRSDSHFIR